MTATVCAPAQAASAADANRLQMARDALVKLQAERSSWAQRLEAAQAESDQLQVGLPANGPLSFRTAQHSPAHHSMSVFDRCRVEAAMSAAAGRSA